MPTSSEQDSASPLPPQSLKSLAYTKHVNFPVTKQEAVQYRQLLVTCCFAIQCGYYSTDTTAEASPNRTPEARVPCFSICCRHSRSLESAWVTAPVIHPKNSWGHHVSCKTLLFHSKVLPAQALLPADFHSTHPSLHLDKAFGWSSLWLSADIYALTEGCGSLTPHTVLGRRRKTPVYSCGVGHLSHRLMGYIASFCFPLRCHDFPK